MRKNNWSEVPKENWNRQREMRSASTVAEQKLWELLRNNQLGVHFRRQHTIGRYIVDFCAPRNQLIIEVDGDTHSGPDAEIADRHRSDYLHSQGYRIIRFSNLNVHDSIEDVLHMIRLALNPPNPPNELGGT